MNEMRTSAQLRVVFAALMVSVAACDGGEAMPTPIPVSILPSHIAECSNRISVPDPHNNPDLVKDCAILLEARIF